MATTPLVQQPVNSTANLIWTPFPGPQEKAFRCDATEVLFGGGRGCVHPDTLLDTPTGPVKICEFKGGLIHSYANGDLLTTLAMPPVQGTKEDLYEVVLDNGASVVCTDEHKFLTKAGWTPLCRLPGNEPIHTRQGWSEMRTIRCTGRGHYWDIHVPETNCYFAQGILHHNSGKSALLCGKAIQHVAQNGALAKMIYFRQNVDDLGDLTEKIRQIIEPAGLAKYIGGNDKIFRFLGPFEGAWLKMRQLDHVETMRHFKGHEFTLIGFDEICDFDIPFAQIRDWFFACLRNPHGIKGQILYTGNPGGPNHPAIKKYFIDPWPQGERLLVGTYKLPNGKILTRTRCYFQSTIQNNPKLLQDDEYVASLEAIEDPIMRRAWLLGDWSVSIGSMFGDVWKPEKHVLPFSITPADIPPHVRRLRCFDWGSSHPFCNLWYFVATGEELMNKEINKKIVFPHGALVFYRECYGQKVGAKNNTGVKLSSAEVAKEIKRIELESGDAKFVDAGPADNQIFQVLDGTPIYKAFYDEGIEYVTSDKSPGSVVTSCELIRTRLVGVDGTPMIYFTRDCVHTLRTLPDIVRDKARPDSPASNQEDHTLAAIRYACLAENRAHATIKTRIKENESRSQFYAELERENPEYGQN